MTDGIDYNLFWETRGLTQSREDHLTCFLAAALECDASFRRGYESIVLTTVSPATIERVATQVSFDTFGCRPDLRLELQGGRSIVCEHKLDSPETTAFEAETGEVRYQLERYLELPVDGVAYFRSALVEVAKDVVDHPHYIHPPGRAHFLWRDLYPALEKGEHVTTRWLLEGFQRLCFTPAVPHVGELWGEPETEEIKANQSNFGKLWDSTRAGAREGWKAGRVYRHGLDLRPLTPSLCRRVEITPAGPNASLLRFRCEALPGQETQVFKILEAACGRLPYTPEIVSGTLPNGRPYVDLLVSLHSLLSDTQTADEQEARLHAQVVPLLEALMAVDPAPCTSEYGW
jgi:hypothetical protein